MRRAARVRNYAALPEECEIVALAELRRETAARVAARYGIPRVYRNHEELLAKETIDAIVASQPFTRHGIILPELAKKGVPIPSEKPVADSIAVAEKIVKALEADKTGLMVGDHKRSDPPTVAVRLEIDHLRREQKAAEAKRVA
jgi:predicted dehydrogenase